MKITLDNWVDLNKARPIRPGRKYSVRQHYSVYCEMIERVSQIVGGPATMFMFWQVNVKISGFTGL